MTTGPGPRAGVRIAVALAATAMLVASVVMGGAIAANAQETTTSVANPPSLPVGLSLVSQTPWVALRSTFSMKLHIDNPTLAARPGAAIAIRIDPSATSRSGFDAVIDNQDAGNALYVPEQIRISSLLPDKHGDVSLQIGLNGSPTSPRIGLKNPGVYPVEVQLVNTGVASGKFVTWLVVVDNGPKPIDKPLSVAFVFQAVAPPSTLPDGTDDPKVVAEFKPGGRLYKVASLLTHTKNFRLSLLVGPETAAAWKRASATNPAVAAAFAVVRTAAARSTTELLPTTYVPIDQAALEAAGLGSYLPGQYTEGASALRTALHSAPAPPAQSAFIDPAPTSDAVVNSLRQNLIDRVAVREQALIPVNHQFTPAEAFVLNTTGGDSRAVATAPFIERLFNGNDPSALRAERVVAALAEVAYETPSIPRGLVIAPPANWTPDLHTMETVLSALRTLPLVQSATLDDLFGTIANEQALGTDVQQRLVSAVPASTPVDPVEYRNTQLELTAYRDMVGAQDPVVVRGEAALSTVLSTSITASRAHTALAQIDAAVHAFTSGVTADEKRITLTSRRADVPLSFENNLKPARNVTIRVHLDSSKLLFPKGADQVQVLKPGSNTIRFTVEARASGTFPMTIYVTSPDGGLQFGAPVRVSVRSAVFGGWAVGVTVAALVFLAGWWANHFRRTRKGRRAEAMSPTTGGATPAPTT